MQKSTQWRRKECPLRGKRQKFSRECKLEAVRLLEEGKKPSTELAREPGIRKNQLYKGKGQTDKQGGSAFPGPGRQAVIGTDAEEMSKLRRELAKVNGKSPKRYFMLCLKIGIISGGGGPDRHKIRE
jgi:transposase